MPEITEQEKKEIINDVIQRLLYCDKYKEELKHLNEHFDPKNDGKTRFTTNVSEFKFPLNTVIN